MAEELSVDEIRDVFEMTVQRMQSLGVYKSEFDGTIQIYAQLVTQYQVLTERFEEGQYQVQSQTAQGGLKKAPIVATLESLRKDVLSYADRLCLTPRSYGDMKVADAPKVSKLEAAMEKMIE